MKITMETDYAFRIMRFLASAGKSDAKTVADEIGAPQRFTVKILGKLVSGNLVTSKKGSLGGYELAKPASDITIKEIFELTEGPLTISRCSQDGISCPHDSEKTCACFFNRLFDEINISIAEKLSSVTVADSL